MDGEQEDPVLQRLDRLEAHVASLQSRLDALLSQDPREQPGRMPEDSLPAVVDRQTVSPANLATRRVVRSASAGRTGSAAGLKSVLSGSTEGLLNKLGIGLLLLGVVFLFKYSVDQGWITEPVRVLFGALIGAALLVVGFRVRRVRPILAPVLEGGGIAALYVTVYAAFQMYALVPHSIAFVSMVCITGGAFVISVANREAWLSLIAVAGGFATPFLLHTGGGSLAALIGYTCVVIAGAAAIYTFTGWRSLLFTSAFGSFAVILVAFTELFDRLAPVAGDRVVMQLGIGFAWLAFAAAPVVWELAHGEDPDARLSMDRIFFRPTFLFASGTPLVAAVFSQQVWPVGNEWGWVPVGMGVLYAAGSVLFDREGYRWLAEAHRYAAALLIPLGLLYLVDFAWLPFALALSLVALLAIARMLDDRLLNDTLVVLLFLVGLVLAGVVMDLPRVAHVLLDEAATASLLAVLVIGVGPRLVVPGRLANAFALGGHLLLIAWIIQEIGAMPNGPAWSSMVIGVYAVGLLVIGLSRGMDAVRLTGLFTILGVVAKLLIFDFAGMDALWRILLFIGFGAMLLLLSYFVPSLWRRQQAPDHGAADVTA